MAYSPLRVIASMALIVFFLIIMLVFYNNIFTNPATSPTECRASVELATKSPVWDGNLLRCPTSYMEISNENVSETKRIIAEEISKCWFSFGEGKWNLFETKQWDADVHNFCHICNVLEFEKSNPVSNVEEFLVKNKLQNNMIKTVSSLKKDITYLEYLWQVDDTGKESPVLSSKIDTNQDYAIVYTYSKQTDLISSRNLFQASREYGAEGSKGWQLLSASAGLMVKTAEKIGINDGEEWSAGVLLVPYSKESLGYYCGILE